MTRPDVAPTTAGGTTAGATRTVVIADADPRRRQRRVDAKVAQVQRAGGHIQAIRWVPDGAAGGRIELVVTDAAG